MVPVQLDEGDEPGGDFVAGVHTGESGEGGVAAEGDVDAHAAGELEAVVHFEIREDEVDGTITFALPDLGITEGKFHGGDAGEDEVFLRLVHESVFDPGGDVGEAVLVGEGGAGVEIDVAVLGGDDGKPVAEGILGLHGEEVEVTAEGNQTQPGVDEAGKFLVHIDGVDLRAGNGEIEEGGVCDRADGAVEGGVRCCQTGVIFRDDPLDGVTGVEEGGEAEGEAGDEVFGVHFVVRVVGCFQATETPGK